MEKEKEMEKVMLKTGFFLLCFNYLQLSYPPLLRERFHPFLSSSSSSFLPPPLSPFPAFLRPTLSLSENFEGGGRVQHVKAWQII